MTKSTILPLLLSAFFISLISGTISAQTHKNFKVVTERNAEYPGGTQLLYEFLHRNLQYPEAAKANRIEGEINVSFDVMPDSSVQNITVLNDLGYGTKEEAIRLAELLKFAPAISNSRAVRQNMMMPILFQLYD